MSAALWELSGWGPPPSSRRLASWPQWFEAQVVGGDAVLLQLGLVRRQEVVVGLHCTRQFGLQVAARGGDKALTLETQEQLSPWIVMTCR